MVSKEFIKMCASKHFFLVVFSLFMAEYLGAPDTESDKDVKLDVQRSLTQAKIEDLASEEHKNFSFRGVNHPLMPPTNNSSDISHSKVDVAQASPSHEQSQDNSASQAHDSITESDPPQIRLMQPDPSTPPFVPPPIVPSMPNPHLPFPPGYFPEKKNGSLKPQDISASQDHDSVTESDPPEVRLMQPDPPTPPFVPPPIVPSMPNPHLPFPPGYFPEKNNRSLKPQDISASQDHHSITGSGLPQVRLMQPDPPTPPFVPPPIVPSMPNPHLPFPPEFFPEKQSRSAFQPQSVGELAAGHVPEDRRSLTHATARSLAPQEYKRFYFRGSHFFQNRQTPNTADMNNPKIDTDQASSPHQQSAHEWLANVNSKDRTLYSSQQKQSHSTPRENRQDISLSHDPIPRPGQTINAYVGLMQPGQERPQYPPFIPPPIDHSIPGPDYQIPPPFSPGMQNVNNVNSQLMAQLAAEHNPMFPHPVHLRPEEIMGQHAPTYLFEDQMEKNSHVNTLQLPASPFNSDMHESSIQAPPHAYTPAPISPYSTSMNLTNTKSPSLQYPTNNIVQNNQTPDKKLQNPWLNYIQNAQNGLIFGGMEKTPFLGTQENHKTMLNQGNNSPGVITGRVRSGALLRKGLNNDAKDNGTNGYANEIIYYPVFNYYIQGSWKSTASNSHTPRRETDHRCDMEERKHKRYGIKLRSRKYLDEDEED